MVERGEPYGEKEGKVLRNRAVPTVDRVKDNGNSGEVIICTRIHKNENRSAEAK